MIFSNFKSGVNSHRFELAIKKSGEGGREGERGESIRSYGMVCTLSWSRMGESCEIGLCLS